MPTPDLDWLTEALQLAYPRIWFACHAGHRTRQTPHDSGITDREAGILAHIGTDDGINASRLAAHLGIGKAALSQHIRRLQALGLIEAATDDNDHRRRTLRLSASGRRAVSADSPLDAERVRALLQAMPAEEAAHAVLGLQRLAEAARRLQEGTRRD
jgi:DNA-binding MarR family transcriptional regulator